MTTVRLWCIRHLARLLLTAGEIEYMYGLLGGPRQSIKRVDGRGFTAQDSMRLRDKFARWSGRERHTDDG